MDPLRTHVSFACVCCFAGGATTVNISHLHSAQNYFADKLTEIKVMEKGAHGMLTMTSHPNVPISTFPYKALHDGNIIYTHDGSESLTDEITVVAVAHFSNRDGISSGSNSKGTSRVSEPYAIRVKVIPMNDHVPKIVNNTGTWVWAGGFTIIHNNELGECLVLR